MLNLFHFDGWDLAHAREVAPFPSTIEKLAEKYEEASGLVVCSGTNDNAFWLIAVKLRRLVDWHRALVAARQEDPSTGRESRTVPMGDETFGVEADNLDDGFWNDIMAWTGYNDLT